MYTEGKAKSLYRIRVPRKLLLFTNKQKMFVNKLVRQTTLQFRTAFDVISTVLSRHGRCKSPNILIRNLKPKTRRVTWVPIFVASQAFTIFRSTEPAEPVKTLTAIKGIENLLSKADELYDENKYNELYELLYPHKGTDDVEILWRLTRVLYNMSREESSKEKKKGLVFEAYELIEKALTLTDSHFAVHKWYSILLDMRASCDGIKARIKELQNVKNHMMKAVELNPKDATTLHMLGFWCFNISAMPWYQRKIASTLFATPPTSSFEEALFYFNKAEEVDPNFYSQNLLMLGKTYLQLSKEEKARYYLTLASNYPPRTDEDLQARKEAAELLKKMKK